LKLQLKQVTVHQQEGKYPKSNGMGQVLQETGRQSFQVLPAGIYDVLGPHQGTTKWAGTEQLLPQQCSAGMCLPWGTFFILSIQLCLYPSIYLLVHAHYHL